MRETKNTEKGRWPMPENRPKATRRPPAKKKKRRHNSLRLSLILMFYIVSIVVSFLIYAANFDTSSI